MTQFERSALIGYYRSGATWEEISALMGITVIDAKLIVREYLKSKR